MPNHRQALGTSSTKQRRQVAYQFKTRLAASDRRRVHRQAQQGGITAGIRTSFGPAQRRQSRRRRAGATHSRGGAPGSACSRWAMAVSGAFVNTPFTPLRNIVACRSGLALDRV